PGQGDGVVLAQLDSPPCQPRSLAQLGATISHPTVDLAPEVAPSGRAISRSEGRIELDRLVKQPERLIDRFACAEMQVRYRSQIVVVGIEALGRLVLGAFNFSALQLWRDRPDDTRRQLVLERENVVEIAFKPFRPDVGAGPGVDKLAGDPHTVRRFAQAA